MRWSFPSHACLVALALVLLVLDGSPSRGAGEYVDGWEDGPYGTYVVPDQATWAAYYRKAARVRLGPEQRLPSGVSWRLHADVDTKLAIPRITWMPDAQSMRTANGMLDMVHGGAMLFSSLMGQHLAQTNDWRRHNGFHPLEYDRSIVQTDVGLTYATPTLMSLVDLDYMPADMRIATRIIRGLTFDLRTREMFRVEACPGSGLAYGAKGGDYRFQFGKLLQACDIETYLKFVRLLEAKAALVAEQIAGSNDRPDAWCSEKAGRVVAPHQEIVLYLTFGGLAVHNTEYDPISRRDHCSLKRSPVNPLILPYRELEPFMMPGAWRDELLKLH